MTDLASKFGDSVDWKRITAAAACVLFLSASAAVTFYVTHTYEAYINSDSAAANVLAAEIWRTGQFFPKDWWYVNSDLWVLFKQVFILPWAMAGNNGFAAHSSSVLAGSALLIASGYALLRQVGSTQARAILGASALCFGFSDYYLETVFGEAAYSWQAAAFFISLLLLLKIRKAIKNNLKTTVPLCGLLTLISLFTLANPQRFLVFFIAPVIGAVLLLAREKYLQKDIVGLTYKNFKRGFFCIVPCGIAFVLALFLHRTLLSDLANAKGVSEAVLVPLETLPKTLGYTLQAGRALNSSDSATAARVILVSESFAKQYFGKQEALGATVILPPKGTEAPLQFSVVGVLGDARRIAPTVAPRPEVWVPFAQYPAHSLAVLVRGAPGGLKAVQDVVWQQDPTQAIFRAYAISDDLASLTAAPRFFARFAGLFGWLALTLAVLGTYAILAFNVTERAREFALRTALGARPMMLVQALMWESLTALIPGLVLGLLTAIALGQWLQMQVYGAPSLMLSALLATGLVLITSLAASLAAARPATKIVLNNALKAI